MTDSKFYKFLLCLNQKELRRFRVYLESPYFNVNNSILALYEQFEANLLAGSKQELVKEEVWLHIYPNDSFDYDKLRKLQHKLMELAYDFLAQQIYDSSTAQKIQNLLQSLADKQMDEFMPMTINSGLSVLNKQQNRNGNFFYEVFSIEKYKYILANLESERVKKSSLEKLNFKDIDENLNVFYISEKLRLVCLLMSWSKMIKVETQLPFINKIIDLVESQNLLTYPSISIYYQIYKTYLEPEELNHFYTLKSLIENHLYLFPPTDARDIVNAAINYTIQKQNKGILSFAQDNFELWKHALDSKVILINDGISPWAFKNIITLGLRLKEFDWIENFIDEFGPKIDNLNRDNAVNYNKASLYFYKKRYELAIPLLQKVQFDEVTYGLDAKALLLASYYELDEIDPLYSHIDSFKAFVQRNKSITTDRKKRYIDLIKFTKNISNTKLDYKALVKLKEDIKNSQAASKKWLLEKVDELIK